MFVSDEIVLFQFYFNASYMWNKMLKQIESRGAVLSAELICQSKLPKLTNMEKKNVDNELLYKVQ